MGTCRTRLAGACVVLAATPGTAAAHSLVRPAESVVNYLSADATSLNTLVVGQSARDVVFQDRTVDGGMDPGSCAPGELSPAGFVIETACPVSGVKRVRVDLGEREDTATVRAKLPVTLLGGPGADRLTAGPVGDAVDGGDGDDVVRGGAGDDVVDGGLGDDRLEGGDGADELRARDGIPDTVACGAGEDRVLADTLDEVDEDCERVDRQATAPPPGGASTGDKAAPTIRATAARTQDVGSSRRISVIAASTEAGAVAASGTLDVAGVGLPVETKRLPIAVAGGGVELVLTITKGEHRQVLRALRRKRRVRLRLTVVATDVAGNSRELELPAIRLRR